MIGQQVGRWIDAGCQLWADAIVCVWFTVGDAWHTIRRTP